MKKILLALALMLPMGAMAQAKFGHFNAQEIIAAMPEMAKAQTDMEAMQKQFADELKKMEEEIQTKTADYEKQRDALPESIRTRRETELRTSYETYQQTQQDFQQQLQKAYQEQVGAIQKRVLDAVKKIGDAGGFVYIVDASGALTGSSLPYISTTLSTDVSPELKKALGL